MQTVFFPVFRMMCVLQLCVEFKIVSFFKIVEYTDRIQFCYNDVTIKTKEKRDYET